MVDRTKNRKLIVTAEDTFKISLMRYPCLKNTEKKQVRERFVVVVVFLQSMFFVIHFQLFFLFLQFHGHMSHVMNVRWNNDDKYLFSAGGLDCCTFQWLHKEAVRCFSCVLITMPKRFYPGKTYLNNFPPTFTNFYRMVIQRSRRNLKCHHHQHNSDLNLQPSK